MRLTSKSKDNYRFECNPCRYKKLAGSSAAIRKDNWLEETRLEFRIIVKFIYAWCHDLTSLEYCEREFGMPQQTAIQYNYFMREVCAWKLTTMEFPKPIGGAGRIVEIDESLMSKRKNHAGRILPQKWMFGGICRETKDRFALLFTYIWTKEIGRMQREIRHFLISARYHLESQRNKNNVAAPVDPTAPVDSTNYSMIGSIKREYIENQPLSDTPFNHIPRTPSMIMPSVSQNALENNPDRHHMNTEETMPFLPNTANRSEMAASLGFQTPSAASKFSLPDNNISPTSAFLAQLTSSPKNVTISITAASPEQLNAPENSLPTPRAPTPTAQSNVSSLDGMPDVNSASNGPNVSQNVVNKFCAKKERIEVTEEPALDTRSDVFQGATATEYLDRTKGIESGESVDASYAAPSLHVLEQLVENMGCCSFGGRPPLITEVNTAPSLANSQTNSDVPRNLVAPNGNTYESERDLNLESRLCQGRPHIKIPLILNEFHFDDRWKKRKIPSAFRSAYAVFTFLNRKGLVKEREFLKEHDPAQWGRMDSKRLLNIFVGLL